MQLFAIQGLFIGVIGTVLGVATGLVACWAGKRFGLPLNPDVYYIDRLPIHVDPQSVLASAAAGVVISHRCDVLSGDGRRPCPPRGGHAALTAHAIRRPSPIVTFVPGKP